MAGKLYSRLLPFSVATVVAVLVGTIVTMAYPLVRPEMHVKVAGLAPLPALELAGRDVYQREGCVNCHTQTVRPLKSEVVRYRGNRAEEPTGRYSLAGEFAYDHPFLWGSKRTGPDLAFEGWIKPSAAWQRAHLENPQALVPRSNMPAYAFLKEARLDGGEVRAHMRALRRVGVPYTDEDLAAAAGAVEGRTELDALVAYVLSLGRAVNRGGAGSLDLDLDAPNPLGAAVAAVTRGKALWEENGCGACHGDEGHGEEDVAPDLLDEEFLGAPGDLSDAAYFAVIKGGSAVKPALGRPGMPDGGMQAYGTDLSDEDIWAIVSWLRNQKAHEAAERGEEEAQEHGEHPEREGGARDGR